MARKERVASLGIQIQDLKKQRDGLREDLIRTRNILALVVKSVGGEVRVPKDARFVGEITQRVEADGSMTISLVNKEAGDA